MPEDRNNEESGEKKKYTVVDRRFSDDEEEEGRQESPPETGEEKPPEPGGDGLKGENEPAAGEEPSSEQGREANIRGAIGMVLNVIREKAFFDMGLVVSKHRNSKPDTESAEATAGLFGRLTDEYIERLGIDELGGEKREQPSIADTVEFCFSILQGQVLILMGLVANPATGLVTKDLEQARLGIDFAASLLQQAKPMLPDDRARKLEGMVSDLRINFVNQTKQTT